jgi:hypothetical protein
MPVTGTAGHYQEYGTEDCRGIHPTRAHGYTPLDWPPFQSSRPCIIHRQALGVNNYAGRRPHEAGQAKSGEWQSNADRVSPRRFHL